jgi:alkanesulfonate monooxygenase SsuD/methylene tetrahydromethanopterin reductase-like flavin-dependent oxidoreductase (luciferase family)
MDVGIMITARNHIAHRRPMSAIYQEAVEEAVLAEELGFRTVWAPEHHFMLDEWNPSPLMLLTAIAARTNKIRLGTYVMMMSLHGNPLRLAEEISTLDLISGGRFDLGYAAGNFQHELDIYGVDRKEMFGRAFETLDIVELALTRDAFDYEGKYFRYRNVCNVPKPVQNPFPIWSGMLGPKNVVKSAQRGYRCLSALSPGDVVERYQAAWVEAGRDLKDLNYTSGPLFVHIADTKEQAWAEAGPNVHAFFDVYPPEMKAWLPPIEHMNTPREDFKSYGRKPVAFGPVEHVLDVLSEAKGKTCEEMVIHFHFPGMDTNIVRRSMQQFAREVMPEIKTWPTGK